MSTNAAIKAHRRAVCLAQNFIPKNSPVPLDLNAIMKFTLTYDGRLPSGGNKNKKEAIWEIRKAFHPQLKDLWANHPALRSIELCFFSRFDRGRCLIYASPGARIRRL